LAQPFQIALTPFKTLEVPEGADSVLMHKAALLRDLIYVFLGCTLLAMAGILIVPTNLELPMLTGGLVAVLVTTVISLAILKKGQVRRATMAYVIGICALQFGSMLADGVQAHTMVSLVNLVLTCGFVLGARAALTFSVIMVTVVCTIMFYEHQSALPLLSFENAPVLRNMSLVSCMLATGFIAHVAIRRQQAGFQDRVVAEEALSRRIRRESDLTELAADIGMLHSVKSMIQRTIQILHQRPGAHATAHWSSFKGEEIALLGEPLSKETQAYINASALELQNGAFGSLQSTRLPGVKPAVTANYTRLPTTHSDENAVFVILTLAEQDEQVEAMPFFKAAIGLLVSGINRLEAEVQARQAQRLEAIGQLAGGIAHDFNNYLTTILGNADHARHNLDSKDKAREALNSVTAASERAAALVQKLLLFAREQNSEPQSLDMVEHLTSLRPMLGSFIQSPIDLRLTLPAEPIWVHIDPTALEQIIVNLLLNAKDAIELHGKIEIQVDVSEQNGQQWAVLSVTDTGIGIAPETRARMFEPFYTTKGPTHGTGLGLATVYGCLKAAGGRIDVESQLGHGSTFSAYLPRTQAPKSTTKTAAVENVRNISLDGIHILVVEDEENVRQTLQDMLQSAGANVALATNGREALQVVTSGANVDLVLSDLTMPVMGGMALAKKLRSADFNQPIVLMTGYNAEPQEIAPSLRLSRIYKPLRIKELLHSIDDALNGKPPQSPAP